MSGPLPEHVSIVSVVLQPRRATLCTVTQQSASSPANTTTPQPPVPATLAARFGALLVDWILCVLAAGLFSHPTREAWGPSLVLIVEYAFFVGLFAQTPGMWLARIRCVSVVDGGRIGVFRGALRAALLCLLIPALVMDQQRRGWHDKAAGSIVVAGRNNP